jgi:dihydroneopterin aldolase
LFVGSNLETRIQISQVELRATIGVPDEERSSPQRLTANLTLWPVRDAADCHDDIAQTVNYATVCAETRRFVEERRDKLVETLAHALAVHLLERFEIRRVTVELRKYILPKVEFVAVTVTRERNPT